MNISGATQLYLAVLLGYGFQIILCELDLKYCDVAPPCQAAKNPEDLLDCSLKYESGLYSTKVKHNKSLACCTTEDIIWQVYLYKLFKKNSFISLNLAWDTEVKVHSHLCYYAT
jgi:hypothetical protein